MANERQLTLDDLAGMVSQGFTDVQGQITELRTDVDSRFDRVERDLTDVKYLLTDVVRRGEFLELKQRMDVVERHVGLGPKDGLAR